jgi:hypothetical protein
MDESVEIGEPLEPTALATHETLESPVTERHWPTKPRP